MCKEIAEIFSQNTNVQIRYLDVNHSGLRQLMNHVQTEVEINKANPPPEIQILSAEEKSRYKLLHPSIFTILKHVTQYPDTLLVRFYGLYKICNKRFEIDFVIMDNLFATPLDIHEKYDLKGSTVNRETSQVDWNPNMALKDMDLHRNISLGPALKAKFLHQVEIDTRWLCNLNICDYSLLVGFHFPDGPIPKPEERGPPQSTFREYCGGVISRDSLGDESGKEVIFLGLIDILTTFDLKKGARI